MLVYANYLALQGHGAADAVFRAIGGWLKEQIGYGLRPEQLKQDGEFKGKRGNSPSWLKVYSAIEEMPELYAWVLKNSDESLRGRQWIAELGLKKIRPDLLELSCVVRTDEQSTLIADAVAASQPRVIRYIVQNIQKAKDAGFAASVPGTIIKSVGKDKDSYRGLLAEIEYPSRDYPIVLVSPTADGKYLINVDHLQEKIFGLAQVVQVATDYNSYEMEEILGQPWSAWNGAVNILHIPTQSGFIRGRFFQSAEIEAWGDTQHARIAQILAWVTNNTNIPRLRKRIRPEGVSHLSMRRRLQAVRAKGAGMDVEQLRQELENATRLEHEQAQWIEELERENDRLETEIAEVRAEIDDARSEVNKKEYVIQSLKDRLEAAGVGRGSSVDIERLINIACRNDQPTPLECLDVLQSIHGDKCIILDSARKSAKNMNRFIHGRQLLSMLIRLVTDYRSALIDGGDSKAKKCFGKNEFAAKESETVVNNKAMRRARTFEYEGKLVEMLRHLKIGVEDDETKTIRVHFHWDAQKKRIVIGYCGPHLPVTSH